MGWYLGFEQCHILVDTGWYVDSCHILIMSRTVRKHDLTKRFVTRPSGQSVWQCLKFLASIRTSKMSSFHLLRQSQRFGRWSLKMSRSIWESGQALIHPNCSKSPSIYILVRPPKTSAFDSLMYIVQTRTRTRNLGVKIRSFLMKVRQGPVTTVAIRDEVSMQQAAYGVYLLFIFVSKASHIQSVQRVQSVWEFRTF